MEHSYGGASGEHVLHHLVRAPLIQPVAEASLVPVPHDDLDKALHHVGELRHGDRQMLIVVLPLLQVPPQTAHLLQDVGRPLGELLSLRRQRHALIAPVQQQVSEPVLQIVDDLAQVRLGNKKSLSCLVDRAQLGHLQKIFQMPDVQILTHCTSPHRSV